MVKEEEEMVVVVVVVEVEVAVVDNPRDCRTIELIGALSSRSCEAIQSLVASK